MPMDACAVGIIGVERSFTVQQKDFSSGLIYMKARYYDPRVPLGRGQFLSPDTLVPDPGNLFDYNRYMYTRGNPMKHTDPADQKRDGTGLRYFNEINNRALEATLVCRFGVCCRYQCLHLINR